jgi:hypothetical protein
MRADHGEYHDEMRRLELLRPLVEGIVSALPGGPHGLRWDRTWITVDGRGAWSRGQEGFCACGLYVKICSHFAPDEVVVNPPRRCH